MKLLEYQAQKLLSDKYGIPVLSSAVCFDKESALKIYNELGSPVVLKAQVPCGGRGKAGGIKIAHNPSEVEASVREIFAKTIRGYTVDRILVQKAADVQREMFISVSIDRLAKSPVIMVSPTGGMEIEAIARSNPEAIKKFYVDPIIGLREYKSREIAKALFEGYPHLLEMEELIKRLYSAFIGLDAMLLEINPLAVDSHGEVFALDAKIVLDDNCFFRHPDFSSFSDSAKSLSSKAKNAGISYVPLDGNIGCIVNGAGLAMATMDCILAHGGKPANFLDIGGSSSSSKVEIAMELILENKKVKEIIINIFGGLTRCDEIARGIASSMEKDHLTIPIFARMKGTNGDLARDILQKTGVKIFDSMDNLIEKALQY
ncbi:ADP-forming succinate--CoA ligase subunit beta [bacterium]|nr:ADP-forming succinate--CoA ligase subunit beta [bacterium]